MAHICSFLYADVVYIVDKPACLTIRLTKNFILQHVLNVRNSWKFGYPSTSHSIYRLMSSKMLIESFNLSSFKLIGAGSGLPEIREF